MIIPGTRARSLRNTVYLSLCIVPAIACTLLLLFSSNMSVPVTIWRSYTILLIDSEADLNPVLDSLDAFDIPHVSKRNTHVYINNFTEVRSYPLSAIDSRLDTDDPRYDPYIQGVSEYFGAGFDADSWHVVYVQSERSQIGLMLTLFRCLKPLGIAYRLPELRPVWFFVGPLVAIFALYVFARGYRRLKVMMYLSYPLVLLAAKATGLGLAAVLFIIPGWLLLVAAGLGMCDRFLYDRSLVIDKAALLRGAILFFLGIVCAFVLSVFHVEAGKFRILLLMALMTQIAAVAAYAAIRFHRSAGNSHRIFYGTPLLPGTLFEPRGGLSSQKAVTIALLVLVCVFGPSLVLLSRVDGGLEVAAPEGLVETGAQNALPDLTEYVIHRAFQDSLLYNRTWAYPETDEEVVINRFENEEGRVIVKQSPVLSFDSQWFNGVFRDAAIDGLGAMLLEQGEDVAVQYRSSRGILKVMKSIAAAALIVVPVVYSAPSLTTYCMYGMRNLSLRRKRQTA